MSKIEQNSIRSIKVLNKPKRITIAVLNHIPFESGYFDEMRNVLSLCINHIHSNSDLPFDLLVFDNGSCKEIKHFLLDLKDKGKIQYLFLSEKNLGKGGAWNLIFSAAPGEIIAYADNDVLFHPKWLSKSVQLLETFPRVGMVTARPFRTKEIYYSATLDWAKNKSGVKIEKGTYIPWDTYLEFDKSIGIDEEEIKRRYVHTFDYRLTYNRVQAIVGASHWQFTTYKKVIQEFLPFIMDKPMGQVKQLDERMNNAKYLRLMVNEPCAMNMSNKVPSNLRDGSIKLISKPIGFFRKLLDFPIIKKFLLFLNNKIFHLYYDR